MNKPFEQCYWVIENRFLAGEYPRAIDYAESKIKMASLRAVGINAFVDLTTPEDRLASYETLLDDTKRFSFPIADVSIPENHQTTLAILDCIDQQLLAGNNIYLHCWGGVGRTGVVVGCWLSRQGHHGENALHALTELWKRCSKSAYLRSPETQAQKDYVRNWQRVEPFMEGARR